MRTHSTAAFSVAELALHDAPDCVLICCFDALSHVCRYAIAHAVLAHLTSVDCRLMFATHYHNLTQEFGTNARVRLAHMGALVHPPEAKQAITFLYTLTSGACPSSYGLEVSLGSVLK